MELRAKIFLLRYPKESDVESWYKNYQDPEIAKNFMTVPKSIKEAKAELLVRDKNQELFVIDVSGEAVGTIDIHDIISGHKATISYWVASKARGQGIATDAVKLATAYALNKYKLKRVQGYVRTFNKPSARVLEKAGYILEGTLRKNKLKNGVYLDDFIY
ncbi:MAG: hypothetical protein A3D92_10845, partial [Bacteroidetes bacterium RIFCSPHIGHO2_02_FULL_44_7]